MIKVRFFLECEDTKCIFHLHLVTQTMIIQGGGALPLYAFLWNREFQD